MADNTKQWNYINFIKNGFEILFLDRDDVFVAGDLLWYAEEGNPKARVAPDTLIAFGRPKGYRGSYKQWEEDGIAPQVVFEVLSPGNTRAEMGRKLLFYDHHGVEEYYEYDPGTGDFVIWAREPGGELLPVNDVESWVSPRTGVRFKIEDTDLVILQPDGHRFLSAAEHASRADAETARADAEAVRADAEAARAARLAAMLHKAGIDPVKV